MKLKKMMVNTRYYQHKTAFFKEKLMRGDIRYNLIKLAHDKKEKFNLIIISSQGRNTVRESFLGSVSNYNIHSSKIPVLIVK